MTYPWVDRAFPFTSTVRLGAANGAVWAMEGGTTSPRRSYKSTDGLSFVQQGDMPMNGGGDGNWSPPAYSSSLGRLVSVDASTFVGCATSDDNGVTWTRRSGLSLSFPYWGVAWGLGRFVAICGTGPLGATYTKMADSADGITWSTRTVADDQMNAIAFCSGFNAGAGRFVALSPGGGRYSDNGTSWTESAAGIGGGRGLAYSPSLNLLVGVGNSLTTGIRTTANGTAWTTRTIPAGSHKPVSVCWDDVNGKFIIGLDGSSGAFVLVSSDGITWATEAIPTTRVGYSIAQVGGVPMAAEASGNSTFLSAANPPAPTNVDAVGFAPFRFGTPDRPTFVDATGFKALRIPHPDLVKFAPRRAVRYSHVVGISPFKFGTPTKQ